MKERPASTLPAFYQALLGQLASWQVDLDRNPDQWHSTLQRAIDRGAFIRLHFGFGAGGVVGASLVVVSRDGAELTPLSQAEAHHA